MKKTKTFTHIHVHTEYSLLDGMGSPKEKAEKAKELGMKAIAITDHNHLGGCLEFKQACKSNGIKPLLGVELYWTWNRNIITLPLTERDKMAKAKALADGVDIPKKTKKSEIVDLLAPYQYDTTDYHILLIAKNQIGWRNLVRLQSEASTEGTFNGRYHCDNELLRKYSEGIICTTACISSVYAHHLRIDKDEVAYEQFEELVDIFGKDNVFVEIQGSAWKEQYKVNKKLIKMANDFEVKLIATNDSHYTNKDDNLDHDVLLCVGTGAKVNSTKRMKYAHEYWLRDYDEMIEAFKRNDDSEEYMSIVEQALENTNYLADMVDDNISLGSDIPLFTKTTLPAPFKSNEKYLTARCWKQLYKYLAKHPEFDRLEYEARLNWELHVINTKGYAPYMLTVEEFITWANSHGCPTGPGRGSAAGSLVLFLLEITKVLDPIQNGLLFSRFLTMDRTALPDVDVDFCFYGRQSVIEHMEDKYGQECVAHIGTYTEFGVKNGIKDIARALNIDFKVSNTINKKISEITDDAPGISFKTLDGLAETDPEKYKIFKQLEDDNKELFRLARRFEGSKRNLGVHASGLLVTPCPVNDIFPTRLDAETGIKVTLYTGPQVEECNGVKYDFLGLKTVSVINQTLKAIDESLEWKDLYQAVSFDDEGVFEMICNRETDSVFQIESDLFKSIIKDMQPTHLNDIVVLTALGRPGPLQAGMHTKYNNRKNGKEPIVYPVPNIEDIIGDTFGTIVYQEQVMAIAKKIAEFDDNQADSYLRKALAKKKKYMMDLCKRWLIYGKINEKVPEGYDNDNPNCVMYDEKGKYGAPIKGALNKGYNLKELETFWTDMEGYASYLFNKSHAACYSYITLLTAYLKKYYPVKFFASVLSVNNDEVKRAKYAKVIDSMDMNILIPTINGSSFDFIANDEERTILYGLASIKGVGENAIKEIIAHRPYDSLEDLMNKVPKKYLNKRVGVALIKAGALDEFNTDRKELLRQYYTIRKDKDDLDELDEVLKGDYSPKMCMQFEMDTLGITITYKPWWDTVKAKETIEKVMKVTKVREHQDKNGNMMAFIKLDAENCEIDGVVFARTYCNNVDKFDLMFGQVELKIKGKKDEKGQLIVSSVKTV